MNRWHWMALGLLALAAAGCSAKLETGYVPRTLGSSDTARRGYYASPFSPEANAAADDAAENDLADRRPKPGM